MKISDQGGNEDDEREESSYVGLCEEGRDDCRVMALGDWVGSGLAEETQHHD